MFWYICGMKLKTLLGERVMVLPEVVRDETTSAGIIIPAKAKQKTDLCTGTVVKKGTGTPWNRMENIHVKQQVLYKHGSGKPYEEERDGMIHKYLILSYSEILFE